jgi:hypothetical protein
VVVAQASPAEIKAALAELQIRAPALIDEWQRRAASARHPDRER